MQTTYEKFKYAHHNWAPPFFTSSSPSTLLLNWISFPKIIKRFFSVFAHFFCRLTSIDIFVYVYQGHEANICRLHWHSIGIIQDFYFFLMMLYSNLVTVNFLIVQLLFLRTRSNVREDMRETRFRDDLRRFFYNDLHAMLS